MAIRYIDFNVDFSGVTPETMAWGGVQYENNATALRFKLDESIISTDYFYRIDLLSPYAGYDPSENLTPDENNCILREISQKFTQYAGEITATVVIIKGENEEILSVPVKIYFTPSKRDEKRIYANISAYEAYLEELISQAENTVKEAEELREELEIKISVLDAEYVKNTQFADSSGNGGIVRIRNNYGIGSGRYGSDSPQSGDTLIIVAASNGEISSKTNKFKPITPSNIDHAVKVGLAKSKVTWTDDEKAQARKVLGISDKKVLVENFNVENSENDVAIPANERLKEGQTYTWSYFAGEYPGWISEGAYPGTKIENTSLCQNVEVDGTNYLGFYVSFPSWADGSELKVTVYQQNDAVRVRRNFTGCDVLNIYK